MVVMLSVKLMAERCAVSWVEQLVASMVVWKVDVTVVETVGRLADQ